MKKLTITIAIILLQIGTINAQDNFQPFDLKISKDTKMIDKSEVQNGLLVDNYIQLVKLITKHNKVKLSQEFRKQETEFFKNNAYYFVPIPTHCGQPAPHNIIAKCTSLNKIDINCISVFSGPVCPGAKYPEIYSLILPKKYLTEKKVVVTIKEEEVIEHPEDDKIVSFETLKPDTLTAESFIGKHIQYWHLGPGGTHPEIELFKNGSFTYVPHYIKSISPYYFKEGKMIEKDSTELAKDPNRREIKGKWKFENKILYLIPTDNKLNTLEIKQGFMGIIETVLTSWIFTITGTWEVVYHFEEKNPRLEKHNDKNYSIESITFLDDKSFIHKRTPPCGLDVFFTKKGTYEFVNNRLTLNYVGGEKYKDNSGGGDCKGECITKKEQLIFNYSIKNTDTIVLENLLFEQKLKEAYQREIIKERKNNQFGYIKGTIGTQKIWFNSYEITQLWKDQVKDAVKKEPDSTPNAVAKLKGKEYIAMNPFKDLNLENTEKHYWEYYSTMITLMDTEKDLSKTIKLTYEYSVLGAQSRGKLQTCDKTNFKNIHLKNGNLSGKITGKMKYENSEDGYVDIDLEFNLKPTEYK